MPPLYDAIVIGTGGVGSAALFHLARRGLRVLGLDRFAAGHDRGSSHGHTRLIRQAYFEHPDYVPLLLRAYELWHELEAASGRRLFERCGLLQAGPPEGVVCGGVLRSAELHNIPVDTCSDSEARRRWPMFHFDDGMQAVYEPTAGMLYVEQCVRTHVELAVQAGAEYLDGISVEGWTEQAGQVQVDTDNGSFTANKLVVAGGAWSPALLSDLPLQVVRKHLHWFANDDLRYQLGEGCPGYFFELPAGCYYGMPQCDARGVKAAEHSGGDTVTDPTHVDRQVDAAEQRRVLTFLNRYLPTVSSRALDHTVCMYTKTPDEHFVVDSLGQSSSVFLTAGLSGHGFKFTSVLGEVLADLVTSGRTSQPISFLSARRFS